MRGEDLIQQFRTVVVREAEVLDKSLLFLLFYKIPKMEFIVFPVVVFLERVEQIIVEIACARALQTGIELLLGSFFGRREHERVDFGAQRVPIPGIAVDERLFDRGFRADIHERRVEIRKSGVEKQIDHGLGLFDVRVQSPARQTHQSEPEFGDIFSEIV